MEENGFKTQNRGLPDGFGLSFGGRFVLFAGNGKDFLRRGRTQDGGFLLLSFWGRRQTHSSRGGLFFDTASIKASIKLLRGSIGRGVFRGFWLNLPGILDKLFHFSGDSG